MPNSIDVRITTMVVAHTSRRVGQVTRPSSLRTSLRKRRPRPNHPTTWSGDSFKFSSMAVFKLALPSIWQARRDSNPQLPVLETGALPIELLAYLQSGGLRPRGPPYALTRGTLPAPF